MGARPVFLRRRLLYFMAASFVAVAAAGPVGPPPAAAAQFTDVPPNAWYAEAISELASAGILGELGLGKLNPYATVTRAEAFATVSKALGLNEISAPKHSFSDVPSAHWAMGAINALSAAGIIKGHNGQIKPDEPLTREAMIVLLLRGLGIDEDPNANQPFSDVLPGHWAENAIATAAAYGITNGVGNGKFGIGQNVTRAELAGFLYKPPVREQLPGWQEYVKGKQTEEDDSEPVQEEQQAGDEREEPAQHEPEQPAVPNPGSTPPSDSSPRPPYVPVSPPVYHPTVTHVVYGAHADYVSFDIRTEDAAKVYYLVWDAVFDGQVTAEFLKAKADARYDKAGMVNVSDGQASAVVAGLAEESDYVLYVLAEAPDGKLSSLYEQPFRTDRVKIRHVTHSVGQQQSDGSYPIRITVEVNAFSVTRVYWWLSDNPVHDPDPQDIMNGCSPPSQILACGNDETALGTGTMEFEVTVPVSGTWQLYVVARGAVPSPVSEQLIKVPQM